MKRPTAYGLVWLILVALATGCHPAGDNASSSHSASPPDTGNATASYPDASPASPADTVPADRVITPGTSIGKTFLDESPDTLIQLLGKPDYQDAAMGKAWLTWFGKKRDEHNNATELNVFLTYRDSSMSRKVVKQIRTTSAWFLLQDSLHVYSGFPQIREAFPHLHYTGQYREGNREFKIYDDLDQGVAFETVTAAGQTLCTAILVHVPDQPLSSVYFPIHGDRVPSRE